MFHHPKDGWFIFWLLLLILLGIFFAAAASYLYVLFILYLYSLPWIAQRGVIVNYCAMIFMMQRGVMSTIASWCIETCARCWEEGGGGTCACVRVRGGVFFQSEFSARPASQPASQLAMEGRIWGIFQTLHLDWEICYFVRQMQRCSERERWCDVTRPCVDLIVRNLCFNKNKHHAYHLLCRYIQVVFGVDVFEHNAELNIVILKWLFLLDQLASESLPIAFPVANHLLYGDHQWLPGRKQRECLLPPWELLPRNFLFDHKIPLRSLDVEVHLKELEILFWIFRHGQDWVRGIRFFALAFGLDSLPQYSGLARLRVEAKDKSGSSLNGAIEKGPNRLNDLFAIL